ncbi:diguanylate cyclase domain-containing protein [Paenibacillus riograndensis]|uniref:diguanylate cyclase domain-containing protein n=1 Tax=Paenibacillus riograndensis TaxID=483937 RepID=UPI0012FE2B01
MITRWRSLIGFVYECNAERIRNDITLSNNGICKVTISIGITLYKGGNYLDSIKMADVTLYHAKGNGRNQVKISDTQIN